MTATVPSKPRTCRLTLTISGVDYIVKRIKNGVDRGWSLKRDGTTTYHVVKDQWGVVRCDCEDDRSGRHKHRGECKHSLSLIACGLIAPSYRAKNKKSDFFEAVL
jgi:hypothetical protein